MSASLRSECGFLLAENFVWHEVNLPGLRPPPRHSHVAEYFPSRRALLITLGTGEDIDVPNSVFLRFDDGVCSMLLLPFYSFHYLHCCGLPTVWSLRVHVGCGWGVILTKRSSVCASPPLSLSCCPAAVRPLTEFAPRNFSVRSWQGDCVNLSSVPPCLLGGGFWRLASGAGS